MFNFVVPALTAIGINSGMNLLRKRPIFEGAAQAGVTGGVLGGFNGGGGLFSSNPAAAAAPTSAGAFEAAMGLPQTTSAIESAGMVFNPATGTYLNPEYYAGATTPLATYTGGEGLLSNAMSNIGDKFSGLGDNLTPQNLLGVSSLLNNMNNTPRPVASGANTITGTPPKFAQFQTGQVYDRKRRGNA